MRTSIAVLAALATLAAPQVASAADVFHFVDAFAFAGFRSTDASGCVQTNVLISAGNDVNIEPPGSPERTSGVFVRVTQFDRCAGTFVFCSGNISGVDYRSNPSLMEATLSATGSIRCGSASVAVAIDMRWTGTGERERDVNNVHFDGVNAFFHGASRAAVASGTVVLGGVNVTPNQSVTAEIVHDVGHEVRIESPN
jgi:hypothetical protein